VLFDRPYLPQDGDPDRSQIFLRQPLIKHCGDFIVGGCGAVGFGDADEAGG
jgi:hypothetical protein